MSGNPKRLTRRQEGLAHFAIRLFSSINVCVYRCSGGRLFGTLRGGIPVLLLTTTGRKSGKPHTVALLYYPDGDDYLIVGSVGGLSFHPGWVHNLEATPAVTIQIGRRHIPVRARRLTDHEHAAVWPEITRRNPDYLAFQARTERGIRMYRLTAR